MQHCNKYWINVIKKTNNYFTQMRMLQNAKTPVIFHNPPLANWLCPIYSCLSAQNSGSSNFMLIFKLVKPALLYGGF